MVYDVRLWRTREPNRVGCLVGGIAPRIGALLRLSPILLLAAVASGCVPDPVAISTDSSKVVMALRPEGGGTRKRLHLSDLSTSRSEQYNKLELYLYCLRTREVVRLTENDVCDVQADFSPDGRRLVFCSGDPEKEREAVIQVMTLADKSVRPIAKGFLPDWSPAGDHIAFLSFHSNPAEPADTPYYSRWMQAEFELRIINPEGNDEMTVYSCKGPPVWIWSHDGRWLFWFEQDDERKTGRILRFDVTSRQSDVLIELPSQDDLGVIKVGYEMTPIGLGFDVSHDGRYLALTVSRDGPDTVAVVNLKTRVVQHLDTRSEFCGESSDVRVPHFSPSGKLSTSFGYDPWAIFVWAVVDGKWQRAKEIWANDGAPGPGYYGNLAWLVVDGKEKMLAFYGQTDSEADFWELHLIDAETGRCERNLTEEIRAAWAKADGAERQDAPNEEPQAK